MINAFREKRLLLATCGLPLGTAQLTLLVLSVFLHSPAEASEAPSALSAAFHQHDFQLAPGARGLEDSSPHCVACKLERNPARFSVAARPSSEAGFSADRPRRPDTPPIRALPGSITSRAPPRC